MRFSTAASGTSLTRTQIFKCGLLLGVLSGDSYPADTAMSLRSVGQYYRVD
jgi:hypothetical protein